MTADTRTEPEAADPATEAPPPACVMSFNATDASGAGGSAGDIATIAAMGGVCRLGRLPLLPETARETNLGERHWLNRIIRCRDTQPNMDKKGQEEEQSVHGIIYMEALK